MPSTQPYSPTYDFPGDPAPQNLVNAQALQAQFQLVAANFADLITALGTSIRDDNTLADGLVRIRNLHTELITYLDSHLTGTVLTQNITYLLPVKGATVANLASLSSPGAGPTIDGVAYVAGDRILVKDQTDKTQNGVWIVQTSGAGVWTRAPDMATGAAIDSNTGVVVVNGTANANSAWQRRPAPTTTSPDVYPTNPVVNTDKQEFFQIYGPFPLPVSKGGTGATTAVAARANLGATGKATATITGDGVTTLFPATHSLNSSTVSVTVIEASTGELVQTDIDILSVSQVAVSFAEPPALAKSYTIVIIG